MLKELRKLAYLSLALAAIAYSPHSANAAPSFLSAAGACTGADTSGGGGVDCVTTTGHISASVVSTLTINELRAISFGNMAKPCAAGACAGGAQAAQIVLAPATGVRTYSTLGTDAIILLHGAGANDGAGGQAGAVNSGGQSPGILSVTTGAEGGTTQVYISFADNAGNPVDFTGEDYWTANDTNIHVTKGGAGPFFTVKDFAISCLNGGSDVFGHYCDNATLPLQIKVGATLVTSASTYVEGKYTGTYNAMVSY